MSKGELRRELGLVRATMLGVGGTLSAGNFVILGHAAGLAGTAIVVVVVSCGIISLLTMFSYCELGTIIPMAGSEYTFAKVAYGGFVAFITGWFEWVSNMFYAALSSVGFAYIISYFIPINIPLIAVLMVIVFTVINVRGVKEVGTTECLLTLSVLAILAIYVFSGWLHSQGMGAFELSAPRGLGGTFQATAYLFELYLGAEAIAVAQAEIKNPEKTIPRAMILASMALIVIYTTIVYVTVRIVPPDILKDQASPMAYAAEQIMGKLGAALVTIGIAIAGLAAINEAIMAQSRTLFALSRDGYFPKALSRIHKHFGTPHVAVAVSSVFTIALAATGFINFIVYAVNFGFIVGFSIVNLSLIRLRRRKPHLKRPFKAPAYPVLPIAGLVTSLFLLLFIEPAVLILGLELTIIALLAYYIRMVGYIRIRMAFGGLSLGIGGFAALLAYLVKSGFILLNPNLTEITTYILIFISLVHVLAGILNITTKS
ncbi:MAG: APC family permease [Candidatus Bathyarchaeaceae archaeon]